MGLEEALVAIIITGSFVTAILFLIFAQVTVRKLEKNPETKHALGLEFTSGWRILNVAEALVLPMGFFRLMSKSPLFSIYANAELLRLHTNRIDRFFAHLFFWAGVATFLFGLPVVGLSFFGFLD